MSMGLLFVEEHGDTAALSGAAVTDCGCVVSKIRSDRSSAKLWELDELVHVNHS